MVAEYLEKNYDRVGLSPLIVFSRVEPGQFFASFTTLILSTNYVTKRQSLKLLGEILLDRANFNVMTRYIAQEANLKMMMNMLRDKSKNIQFEAFHVFKVRRLRFSPNPLRVRHLLYRFSLPIQRNRLKSKSYSGETRRNYLHS